MKLTVIGGGGVRSLFLARTIAFQAEKLNIDELCFMDTDNEKLSVYGTMAKKVAEIICPSLKFCLTLDPIEAVKNADYVITTIRVGGDYMRCADERTALNLGVLGQETTGAAGFSFAMRSIPTLIEYCKLIGEYSKTNVKVFNFTNPAGLVSQALSDSGFSFSYGICDAPTGMLRSFAEVLGVSPNEIHGEIYGLNHLSFFNKVTVNGEDVTKKLISNEKAYELSDMRYFSRELLERKLFIPNEYLYYYFDSTNALKHILHSKQTRGEQIAEINSQMTSELKKIDCNADFDKALKIFEKYYGMRENSYMASETGITRDKKWQFDINSQDGGGYAGVALKYIDTINADKKDEMILCTRNNGAIEGLFDSDIVEITCDISKDGIVPHKFSGNSIDPFAFELIKRVKLYERQASLAILNKDKFLAVDALALHPLVSSYTVAEELVSEYSKINSEYIILK